MTHEPLEAVVCLNPALLSLSQRTCSIMSDNGPLFGPHLRPRTGRTGYFNSTRGGPQTRGFHFLRRRLCGLLSVVCGRDRSKRRFAARKRRVRRDYFAPTALTDVVVAEWQRLRNRRAAALKVSLLFREILPSEH